MGEDVAGARPPLNDTSEKGQLENRVSRLDGITEKLSRLGARIAGPNVRELVELVDETAAAFSKSWPTVHESLFDFIPEELWPIVNAHEQRSRQALRAVIKAAGKARQLIDTPAELAGFEADPFKGALQRLSGIPATLAGNARVNEALTAIRILSALPELLGPEEKPGQRRKTGLAGPSIRATFYYRAKHDLPLTVHFHDVDRAGVKPGTRSRQGDLVPSSPTAVLACTVLQEFEIEADAAEVRTHLRNYLSELHAENRIPALSDFLHEFG